MSNLIGGPRGVLDGFVYMYNVRYVWLMLFVVVCSSKPDLAGHGTVGSWSRGRGLVRIWSLLPGSYYYHYYYYYDYILFLLPGSLQVSALGGQPRLLSRPAGRTGNRRLAEASIRPKQMSWLLGMLNKMMCYEDKQLY